MAKHVFNTYFSDTSNPLVRHHLDSYAELLDTKLPQFIKASNPQHLVVTDDRFIDVYVGGRDGNDITYHPPTDELGNAILPHMCRLENKTYSLEVRANIDIVYTISAKEEVRSFKSVLIGRLPLMVRSSLCYLHTMTPEQLYDAGECKFELGGYFIISGAEKVLLTQERLGNNMLYASKRRYVSQSDSGKKSLVEKQEASKLEDSTVGEKFEYIAGIRSASEDGTRGPYSHFLVIPPPNKSTDDPAIISKAADYSQFATNRLAVITLPGFTQPVPLFSVFYALGLTSDQDIYDTIFAGLPDADKNKYDSLFTELVFSHEKFIQQEMKKETDQDQDPNLLVLRRQTRTRSEAGVLMNLYNEMLPHCRSDNSQASLFRRKAYLLGEMVRGAMDVALGIKEPSDRDHFRYKRLDAAGELCFQEFRRVYKDVAKSMLTSMDSRVEFERVVYAGDKIANLVPEEKIGYYWRAYNFLNQFEKSFKGQWGGKDGISQELSRLTYLGSIAHLRRVNLQMDKGTKVVEPRRIHSSSWGLMCPTDNPDGHNIGMIKSMTLFCSLSTASPSADILKICQDFPSFRPLSIIHPSTWNPRWTKVYLNADLIGVFEEDANEIHDALTEARHDNTIPRTVSLSWNRQKNQYSIFTDAGRPMRPVYRKGVSEERVNGTKSWNQMKDKLFEFLDAEETETVRLSMEPFSPKYMSEIHGTVMFSASGSVIPHPDFNQAPRNMFSCQQTKQACSWFNTAFNKRFDTIATWLNYAQRPLSHTWTYNPMIGCLPYGENAIVALAIYSGYNQEDSIILNDSSLRRGLFNTTYYHSYDIGEEMIDPATEKHTQFGNVSLDPKYRDVVVRKEGYNYDLLDSNGIIRAGSYVDDKTILAGIVSPITNASGQITGYLDVSYTPKKGQHGVIDGVYVYTGEPTRRNFRSANQKSSDETTAPVFLRGVKIRIAERRIPVLGDKFSARHGQKGTVGMRLPESDMPYTAAGLRPDMIVNPHAFPSRMTIGQFVEMMTTKLGVNMGCCVDSTAFSSSNRVPEVRSLLEKAGMHPFGHEIMYNGMTGEMMAVEIFTAPTYYLRLKHMVEDKINYRSTGPKKLLTHQPTEGRSNDGGLRIGEMERDSLVSHGVSKFLNESLMDRSDGITALFNPESGLLDVRKDTNVQKLTIPYSLGVFTKEIESMHISVKFIS
jgi:DNA-directed RNA polymerase II subunit RPB2